MRELLNNDMFLLSEIIDKSGVKIPALTDKIFDSEGKLQIVKKDEEEWGMEILMDLFKKMYKVKTEINTLLASVLGVSVEEIGKMKIKDTKDNLVKLFKQEGVSDFFKQA